MKYCTGPIKTMRVKSIGVNEDVGKVVTESIILQKDAPFYWNRLGRLVSFEYSTFLPTMTEAENYVVGVAKNNPDHLEYATCMYADYDNMEVHQIEKEEYKELVKTYKQIKKKKKSS